MSAPLDGLATELGDALRRHDPVAIDGVPVAATLTPADETALADTLARLAVAGAAVLPRGAGSQASLGNPPRRADAFLSSAALRGVDVFDPAEGVCHARAGTPLAELRAVVNAEGWELPLDDAGRGGTLGGALATASLAPRAQGWGRPRDIVLGCEVALTDGTLTRCGGRVVKNVTGYDLARLYTGSLGTLGVVTGAWLRLRPLPEATALLETPALPLGEACRRGVEWARRAAVRACVLLPASGGLRGVIELAGAAPAVAQDRAALEKQAGAVVQSAEDGERALREPPPLEGGLGFAVAALAPGLARCAEALHAEGARVHVLPALGLVRAAFAGADDADARFAAVDRTAREAGGRFLCEAAPPAAKRGRDVFAAPEVEVRLTRALKARFDPRGTLNPGRFAGGV